MTQFINGPAMADLWRDAQGLKAETIPHWHCGAGVSVGFVSGTLYLTQIYLQAGMVLTNALVQSASAGGVAVTFAKLALYDSVGNLLRATADQGAGAFTGSGMHSVALTAPLTITTSDIYYAGTLILCGATYPLLTVALSPNAIKAGMPDPVAGKPIYMASQAGLSDLPNPAVIAGGGLSGMLWQAFN